MNLTLQQKFVLNEVKSFVEGEESVFILRGYAGTGKTTMIKAIADAITHGEFGSYSKVELMAPTGRAAKVLSDKSGYEAKTIHRSIYHLKQTVSKDEDDVSNLDYKIVFSVREADDKRIIIVDEASMVCSRKMTQEMYVFGTDNLMEDLLTYGGFKDRCKIIFVGDPAQLPPVGEPISNALSPAFFVKRKIKVREAELTEVLRQGSESCVLKNAMKIRDLLQSEKRNNLVFEEKEGDVEMIVKGDLLSRYIASRKTTMSSENVLICYTNRSASRYNQEIRLALYGSNESVRADDVLMVSQNNYKIGCMNGEFVYVLSVGRREKRTIPVYVNKAGRKEKISIVLSFIQVCIKDAIGNEVQCMLLEDFLTNENASLTIEECRALYIDFCIRNSNLKKHSEEFTNALMSDCYFNALRAKYGYAVTGHKCQGGEWDNVFVDYAGRTGISDDCLRWAYTATTRARKTLYVANLPHINPFDKFRIEGIQKCKTINDEFRVLDEVEATPFHSETSENYLRAKYKCIVDNMANTPYSVIGIESNDYKEIYSILTSDGVEKYELYYKKGGIFSQAKALKPSVHTESILSLLDDEKTMPYVFEYQSSNSFFERLYVMIQSVCDSVSIQLTNVVEHKEDYSVVFYMFTSGTYSYIKVYYDKKGFVTYAKPMSLIGKEDYKLVLFIDELKSRFKMI